MEFTFQICVGTLVCDIRLNSVYVDNPKIVNTLLKQNGSALLNH